MAAVGFLNTTQSSRNFSDALTKLGAATWSLEYRRLGSTGGGWPQTFRTPRWKDYCACWQETYRSISSG